MIAEIFRIYQASFEVSTTGSVPGQRPDVMGSSGSTISEPHAVPFLYRGVNEVIVDSARHSIVDSPTTRIQRQMPGNGCKERDEILRDSSHSICALQLRVYTALTNHKCAQDFGTRTVRGTLRRPVE